MAEDKETKQEETEEKTTEDTAASTDAAATETGSENVQADTAPATDPAPSIDTAALETKMKMLDDKLGKIERTIGLFVESGATIRESDASNTKSSSGMFEDDVYMSLEDLDYNL